MKNVKIYQQSELSLLKDTDEDLKKMTFFGVVFVIDFKTHIKVGCTNQPYKTISDANRNANGAISQFVISKKSTNYAKLRLLITRRFKEQKIGKSQSYKINIEEIVTYMESLEYKDESAELEQHSKDIASIGQTLVLKGVNGLSTLGQEAPIFIINKSTFLGKEIDVYGSVEHPLFRASDVAEWIEHSDVSTMLKNIDEDEKLTQAIIVSGQRRNVWFLTEDGMYDVLLLSRTEKAKQFKKGVKAILHEIRTKGGYIASSVNDTPEAIMARALKIADETIKRNEERVRELEAQAVQQAAVIEQRDTTIGLQQKELTVAAPKVKYYDDTLASTDCLTTTQVADDLGISARNLNQQLANAGIQYFQSGSWHLKGKFREWQLASTRTYNYTKGDGATGTKINLVWNQRGKRFILALFNNAYDVKAAIAEINGEKRAVNIQSNN